MDLSDEEEEVVDVKEACEEAGTFRSSSYRYSTTVELDVQPASQARLQALAGKAVPLGAELTSALDGSLGKVSLYQQGDAFTLRTAHGGLRRGELLGAFAGTVMEAARFTEHVGAEDHMAQVWAWDLRKDLKALGYKGQPLVLSTFDRSNQFNLVQDSTWYKGVDAKANVVSSMRLTLRGDGTVLPVVVMEAAVDIPDAGTELSLDWGEDCWRALSQIQLVHQGELAHQLHHGSYAELRQLCGEHGVQPPGYGDAVSESDSEDEDSAGPASKRPKLTSFLPNVGYVEHDSDAESSGSEDEAGGGGAPRRVNVARELARLKNRFPTPVVPLSEAFKVLSDAEVQACFPGLSRHCDFSRLDAWKLMRFERIRNTQLTFSARGRRIQGLSAEALLQRSPPSPIRRLIDEGTCPKLVVAEVLSLHHPVRWFCPPNFRPKAALARAAIAEGEPIGVYVGRVHEAAAYDRQLTNEQQEEQLYLYEMSWRDLRQRIPGADQFKWLGPLVVENLQQGNETRFINDCYGREDEEWAANAEAETIWDPVTRRPYVLIFATCAIAKGDEIVLSYGERFWHFVSQLLQRQLAGHHAEITKLIKRMKAALLAAGALPAAVKAAAEARCDLTKRHLFQPDV